MRLLLKWTGIILGGLFLLMLAISYFKSEQIIHQRYDFQVEAAALPAADSALRARGDRLAGVYGCRECHGPDLSGQVVADAAPFRFVAPNLTPAGIGGRYTRADWVRALRHGVGLDGRPLAVMPSSEYNQISDKDLAALLAYLEELPPVDHALPATKVRLPGRFLLTFGAADDLFAVRRIDHNAPPPAELQTAPTPAYGAYLYRSMCVDCHRKDLQGGPHSDPIVDPVPALTATADWSGEDFSRALRQGLRPFGAPLDPRRMPWKAFQYLTDDEVQALHAYLQQTLSAEQEPTAQR